MKYSKQHLQKWIESIPAETKNDLLDVLLKRLYDIEEVRFQEPNQEDGTEFYPYWEGNGEPLVPNS
jgi:hypothetical protein